MMQLAAAGLLSASAAQAALVTVTSDIAPSTAVTWYATNEYLLNTMVYVQTNAVLVIEPGTVIKGGTNASVTGRAGLANVVSGLWVTRGGKLYATGTVAKPIIFTMEGDDVNNPNDIPPQVTGKWGGVVIMGNAQINSAQYSVGQAASPKFDVYEGVATLPNPEVEHIFGGTNDLDSSGALKYVSIRHSGNTFAPAKELNGLTMAGVGSGTDISYVEVMSSSDDAFEWWGGTVNTHHLVAAFNEDDDFDTDQGYRGTNQFWFGIKGPWQGSSDSRAIESDGDLNQGIVGDALPFSQWAVYNATFIGRGKTNTLFGGGSGWNARDEAAPNVINSIVAEFNNGLLLDNDGLYHWTNGPLANALNNVWDNTTAGNANGLTFINDIARNNYVGAAKLGGISYTNDGALNPRPLMFSPANTNALAGAPTATSYRGAFSGLNDAWADTWTGLFQEGFLAAAGSTPTETVTTDIAANTTTTWYSGKEYLLNTMVYVQTNAVLVIEPGTVIKGGTNASVTGRAGLANVVSGLWVTRGGKLYATGTVAKPIIFTMEGDDVNNPNDIPPQVTGKWGGVVIMGNAQINSAQYSVGQAASPKFDVYEGVATLPNPEVEHIFGGTNDLDSSGALKYVSIRHSGNTFAPAKELNGLTMAGVGSGTDISYVEVMSSSDDAFEWWGGTVNTHHLVAAFNEDDDFDTDQGYRGTNQFWFGIKGPWQGSSDSRAIESDGDLNQGIVGDALPFSQWAVYNATFIGRGKTNTLFGGGSGWNARDEAAPNVINSIVAEFNNGLLLDNDGLYHWTNGPLANALNNVWDNTTAGNANGLTFINDIARGNDVVAAGLGGISYTNDAATLDPRPIAGSAALTNVLSGAPTATAYRGAFKPNDSWADCWSGLSTEGYLEVSLPELTIQQVGGNVEITWLGLPGKTYQLESTTSLSAPVVWGNEGAALVGAADFITVSVPATGNKYFRVSRN